MTSTPAVSRFRASIFSRCIALVHLFALFVFAVPAFSETDSASEAEQVSEERSTTLQFYDLLSPCSEQCLVTAAYGRYVETNMTDIFSDPQPFPWSWDYGDIDFARITFGRKLADYGRFLSLEPEMGAGRRFGDADEYEIWGALYLRWNPFIWDHIVDTSIAISTGVSYATDNNELEEDRAKSNATWLHYFSPEITLAPPGDSSMFFVLRLHHRSGAGGVFGESGGFQYLMFGLRVHF